MIAAHFDDDDDGVCRVQLCWGLISIHHSLIYSKPFSAVHWVETLSSSALPLSRVETVSTKSLHWRETLPISSALQCTMCTCGTKLSAGLNKLGHILKCLFYYPIQHIFVPCCSVRRNMGKFQFSWASNSKFVIFSQIFPCSNYRFHQGNRRNPANIQWNSIIPL